ncbi:MAG: hypothetical protein V1734_00285 [Nanoarchaeota archaeon]
MLEALLDMDSKGIIAPDMADNEDNYIDYGLNVLEASACFGIDDDIRKLFAKQGITIGNCYGMLPPVVDQIYSVFRAGMSWLPVISAKSPNPLNAGRATCVPYVINGAGIMLPVTLYFKGGIEVLAHECIHTIRGHIAGHDNVAFEEAFANYFVINPEHAAVDKIELIEKKILLSTVRKKLEDKLGDNASYVLVRMSKDEVYGVRDSADAVEHVKGLDTLRMKIVKERLGL